jgi:hypothetical protein
MKRPRLIITIGLFLGFIGACMQVWLMKFGALASAPLRGLVTLAIAIVIGVFTGTRVKENGVKVAALMGVVAGAILTMVGMAVLLTDPSLIGQHPFASMESFFSFVSSILGGTVVASWLTAGIAALVAWPLSLAQVPATEHAS